MVFKQRVRFCSLHNITPSRQTITIFNETIQSSEFGCPNALAGVISLAFLLDAASSAAAAVQKFLILAPAGSSPTLSGLSFGKSPDQLKSKVIQQVRAKLLRVRFPGK